VSRYNPDTGRKVKVPADSPEALAWASRKPPKTFSGTIGSTFDTYQRAGIAAAATYAGTKVATRAERKAAQVVAKALQRGAGAGLGVLAEAAGVGTATAAAGILASAIAGYGLGKAITYSRDPNTITGIALRQLHEAQNSARQRLGRELTKAEAKKLFDAYQLTLARSLTGDPTIGIRPGME
jgi:hypothetical protein